MLGRLLTHTAPWVISMRDTPGDEVSVLTVWSKSSTGLFAWECATSSLSALVVGAHPLPRRAQAIGTGLPPRAAAGRQSHQSQRRDRSRVMPNRA